MYVGVSHFTAGDMTLGHFGHQRRGFGELATLESLIIVTVPTDVT